MTAFIGNGGSREIHRDRAVSVSGHPGLGSGVTWGMTAKVCGVPFRCGEMVPSSSMMLVVHLFEHSQVTGSHNLDQ